MLTNLFWLAVGLALLVLGAEFLVRGASALATKLRISPLVIGLTVVAFGTSAPELAVSLRAGLAGDSTLALANVVGSNIFNPLFILGLCAALVPLAVAQQLIRLEVPLLVLSSIVVLGLARDGNLDRAEGSLLLGGLVAWTAWSIRRSRREDSAVDEEYARELTAEGRVVAGPSIGRAALGILTGLAGLVLGARWFTTGASSLASHLGVDEVVIGLTIVAAGTSMPEVVTSLVATVRGNRDVAVGNVIGSNLFNLLGILGLSALVTSGGLSVAETLSTRDLPIMVVAAVACLPVMFTGARIVRAEGMLLLAGYGLYTAYLVLAASGSSGADPLRTASLFGFIPMAGLVLLLGTMRQIRSAGGRRATPARGAGGAAEGE